MVNQILDWIRKKSETNIIMAVIVAIILELTLIVLVFFSVILYHPFVGLGRGLGLIPKQTP